MKDCEEAPKRTERKRAVAALLFGAAFILYSAAAGLGATYGMDLWLLHAAQNHTLSLFDAGGELFSTAGSVEVSSAAALVLATALFIKGRARLAVWLLVVLGITGLIEYLMKMYLPVPPMPEGVGRTEGYAPVVEVDYPYPYPSGHIIRTTIVLGALYLLSGNRLLGGSITLFLAAMAATRVYLGVHWASDMIGGALLGLAVLLWIFKGEPGWR